MVIYDSMLNGGYPTMSIYTDKRKIKDCIVICKRLCLAICVGLLTTFTAFSRCGVECAIALFLGAITYFCIIDINGTPHKSSGIFFVMATALLFSLWSWFTFKAWRTLNR